MKKITKNTTIQEAREIFDSYKFPYKSGWELAIITLLHEYDYITIDGYGANAKLKFHWYKYEEEL